MGKAVKAVALAGAIILTGGAVAVGAAFYGATAATIGAIVSITNALALSVGLSGLSSSLAGGGPKKQRPNHTVEYNGTAEYRRIIYGQMRVSGLNAIPPWTHGSNNQFLHQVLLLAAHECEDITDVYFNQDTIADANIGAVTGALTDGLVSSGTYANKAWIRRYPGTTSQTVDYILDTAFAAWTSNHRLREIAYLALQYEIDEKVYRTGKPEVACLVKGKKCYDPRLDSSPGADPTNSAYKAWTQNPALITADYLTDTTRGVGIATDKIDWATVVDSANECDELVSIPGSTTQPRYTCNVVLEVASTAAERRANLEILALSMMGYVLKRGALWRIHAGKSQSSSFALTEDDVVGKVTVRTELPADQKYNYVQGQYVDAARSYQYASFSPRSSSAYELEDAIQSSPLVPRRLPKEVSFYACTNEYEAQRNAIILLRRSRNKRQATLELGLTGYKIKPLDIGTITLSAIGWSAQLVRCTAWSFKPEGTITATFVEEAATDWDDPSVGDYGTQTVSSGPAAGGYTPDRPEAVAVNAVADGLWVWWNPADSNPPGTRYRIYSHTASTPFASAALVLDQQTGSNAFVPRSSADTAYYWVTAYDYFTNNESDPTPIADGVAGAALSVTSGFRATTSSAVAIKVGTTSTLTTPSVTVTPTNGTPTYTYAWSWVRIDQSPVGITILSPGTAATAFRATGLALDEQRTGKARCTVTDSSSPQDTATVDVEVNIYYLNTA